VNRYMRGRIKKCWNCKHQTGEFESHIGNNDVILPFCDCLKMGMTGIFVDCEHYAEKEQK